MSYLGQVATLFDGTEGLNGTHNFTQVKPNELIDANSVTYENGPIQKEGGTTPYNATPLSGAPSILGGFDWWPDPVTQRSIIYTSAGTILRDTGSGTYPTTVAGGYTTSSIVPFFFEAGKEAAAKNKKLMILTGKDVPKCIDGDGTTLTAFTSVPADWSGVNEPSCGSVHQFHAWYAGNVNQPHTLYYSTLQDHTDLTNTGMNTGAGTMQVFPGEGSKIVAMLSYKGLLVVWKWPFGVYLVNTTDPNSTNWGVTRVTSAIGAAGPRAIVVIDDDVLWMDAVGNIQSLVATLNFGNLSSINISQQKFMRPWIDANLNISKVQNAQGVYYAAKRQVHFAVAGFGAAANTYRLVVDYMHLQSPRFRYSNMDTCQSLWMRLDTNFIARPASGDGAGVVWLRDQTVKSIGTNTPYTAQFQTPHLDFSHLDPALGPKRKLGQFLEIVSEPTGNWNINAQVLWDGVVKQNIIFNLGITGSTLGAFTLGTDKLAGGAVNASRKRLVGSGRRLSVIFYNNQPGQDFSIARGYVSFLPGSERV
ncbi:MAG: hypothetical protein KGH87_06600 [Thaumarchaeota archaeon]|nr:hypothetical protein [Nitrososphaerota archaeon]